MTKLGVAAGALVVTALLTAAPVAAEPDALDKTYEEVKASLEEQGYTPVFSTSVGDKLPLDECIVTRQQEAPNNRMLLTLDCNGDTDDSAAKG